MSSRRVAIHPGAFAREQPLFSANSVYGLVKAAWASKSKPLPEKGDVAYAHLALILTRLKNLHDNGRPGVAFEREQARKQIAQAIQTLTELLPATRVYYEADIAAAEKWKEIEPGCLAPGYADWARDNLAVLDGLLCAATEARNRGLPIDTTIDCLAPDVAGETDLIKRLNLVLSTSRISLSGADRHRLIADLVRLITGKPMDQEKIRDRLRK